MPLLASGEDFRVLFSELVSSICVTIRATYGLVQCAIGWRKLCILRARFQLSHRSSIGIGEFSIQSVHPTESAQAFPSPKVEYKNLSRPLPSIFPFLPTLPTHRAYSQLSTLPFLSLLSPALLPSTSPFGQRDLCFEALIRKRSLACRLK